MQVSQHQQCLVNIEIQEAPGKVPSGGHKVRIHPHGMPGPHFSRGLYLGKVDMPLARPTSGRTMCAKNTRCILTGDIGGVCLAMKHGPFLNQI